MTLLQALTQNTQDLKKEYIEQTKKWAGNHFDFIVDKLSWNEVKWCEYFRLTPRLANYRGTEEIVYDPKRKLEHMQFWTMPENFYNTRQAREKDRMQSEARSAERKGKDQYIAEAVVRAERHYKDSLDKLVDRLAKKGVSDQNAKGDLSIKKAKVGINLEMFITVGDITAKAWTIVASGAVQRPHYRYLVK